MTEPIVAADWNPDLHPRGRDGQFINVLGWVDVLSGGRRHRGQVVKITPDPRQRGRPVITVDMRDQTGQRSRVNVRPDQIEASPEAKAQFEPRHEVVREPAQMMPVPEGPGAWLQQTDASVASLAPLLNDPIQRRIKRDVEAETGPAWSALWKRDHGVKLEKFDKQALGLIDGKPAALKKLAQSKLEFQGESSDDPELHAAIDATLTELQTNPKFASAVDSYGAVPVMAMKVLPGIASAMYLSDAIAVSELAGRGDATPSPLGSGQYNIGDSLNDTLRHEYGHHIESMLSDKDDQRWREAYTRWGGNLGGPDEIDAMLTRVIREDLPKEEYSAGLSLYGRTNYMEAFAETYALVSHPDFDPTTADPRIREMVDLMTEFTAPAGVTP